LQDIAISSLYLSSKLNETPVRLRDLINTFIYLSARIKHLLSLPADYDLSSHAPSGDAAEGWRVGLGNGKKDEGLWAEFKFDVPSFHDEVFWDCTCHEDDRAVNLTFSGKDVIVASEMQILKRLGFNMQVGGAHKGIPRDGR
jgi:hypothetical protein